MITITKALLLIGILITILFSMISFFVGFFMARFQALLIENNYKTQFNAYLLNTSTTKTNLNKDRRTKLIKHGKKN